MAASESNPIILYDIKSKVDAPAWSPNTWKTRFVLNYKRLPYKTVWVSYPDIASTLSSLGLEPLASGPAYTLPVIEDPTHSGSPIFIRDSAVIAQYLEATYPDMERPIFPGGSHALQALFLHQVHTRIFPLHPHLIGWLNTSILDEAGVSHINQKAVAKFGKPFADLRPKGAELEEAWNDFKKELDVFDSVLQKNDVQFGGTGGDLVLGNQISFADFALVGIFVWMSKASSEDDGCPWDRVRGWHNGRWERMWDKCEAFMQVK